MNFRIKFDQKALTLIELMIVIVIVGVLASIALGISLNLRERAYIKSLESDLSMAYKAAVAHHLEKQDEEIDDVEDLKTYGYMQSDNVEINIIDGRADSLEITATHPGVLGVYKVDQNGHISKK